MLRTIVLVAAIIGAFGAMTGQVIIPDRLPNGKRMPVMTTMADLGVLVHDSVRTFPVDQGGKDTWWHRHALFADGPVRVAMDPVVDFAREWRRTGGSEAENPTESGFRNIRGVRYSGNIDGAVGFGGKVLEMQRVLVGPETEYVLAAQGFPGMGPGKLRPSGDGLFGMDHSLAEVWFDVRASERVRLQWGLGTVGMGPGTRNLLWNADMAPAPYLLVDVDLGRGWNYRWLQSRQRSTERMPADGAREGRYSPLGLAVRSIGKALGPEESRWHLNWVVARWTDVLQRGQDRSATEDWALALAPWTAPIPVDTARPHFLAGHHGLDVQWRRPKSTWYGQVRFAPWFDSRYSDLGQDGTADLVHAMVGHVRHGRQWTVWTEFAPATALVPGHVDPASSGGNLGIRSLSRLQPDWVQGFEWRPAGITIAAELGRLEDHWSWKTVVSVPSTTADVGPEGRRAGRKSQWPNRFLPALVPLSPFISVCHIPGMGDLWLSAGVSSPVTNSRRTH